MNSIAIRQNKEVLIASEEAQSSTGHMFVYNEKEDNWARWNGRHRIEKLSIEKFDMM